MLQSGRVRMKTVIAVFAFLSLSVLVPLGHGQEKSSSEKPRTITPVRLQVVLSEYDGEKKVSSLPYSFLVKSEHGGPEGAYSYFTRVGVRVPVPGAGKDGQTSFVDVGSNIDCGIRSEEDGRFTVRLNFERSSLYFQGRGDDKGSIKTIEGGQPYLPTIRAQTLILLRDGQTLEALMAADPLNGHVFRIDITLNVQK
jgi:hypothetical protein